MRWSWLLVQCCRLQMCLVICITVFVYLYVASNEDQRLRPESMGHYRVASESMETTTHDDGLLHDDELTQHILIGADCACTQKDADRKSLFYDFCYRLPENKTIHGKRFNCDHLRTVGTLGLLDRKRSDYIDLAVDKMPMPRFVTAFSSNHYNEGKRLIAEVQRLLDPNQTHIVVYDLGLMPAQVNEVKSMCRVEYRKFKFDGLPRNVRSLSQFRWKPILIAEALLEFGAVWYMDSSVKIKKNDVSHVYPLLTCRRNVTYSQPHFGSPLYDNGELPLEHSWHKDWWQQSIDRCDKYAYMLQGWTGHGIYPATHPGVYKFIPTNTTALQTQAAKMYEAGFALIVRTREVIRDVLKWYVLCALEDECMAPPMSSVGCRFPNPSNKFIGYVGCHRFDQSVVNLLLANVNNYDRYYWTSQVVDHFNIIRGAGPSNAQLCVNHNLTNQHNNTDVDDNNNNDTHIHSYNISKRQTGDLL